MGTFVIRVVAFLLLLAGAILAADPPRSAESAPLVVLDAGGKEQKVKTWTITAGTRSLGWLVPATEKGKKEAPAPQALVVRDETKIHFLAGVVTLVPVERLRSIRFDNEKEMMTVHVAVSDKPAEDIVLTGTTAYRGINKVTIEAEVDKGDAGIASVTYQGGVPRGVKEFRFPSPRFEAAKKGTPATVTTLDKDVKKSHKLLDVQALYARKSGQERLSPTLFFKKTLKIPFERIEKVAVSSEDRDDIVWQVRQRDGEEASLTLLTSVTLDAEPATLVGLLGRVPAGYQLIPVRRLDGIELSREKP